MSKPTEHASFRVVVLKRDRLYADLICGEITKVWAHATVQVFQRGFDALESIQASVPDLFITGVRLEDMDGLEHLEPFVESTLPILVVTSCADGRTFAMLQELRFDGVYDGPGEGIERLSTALRAVVEHRTYLSPAFVPLLKPRKNILLDALTQGEEVVLSVIGDGSDDREAADRLKISPATVQSHRKAIMRKLGLHQKGELVRYAVQHGYVLITPHAIFQPGFQRRLQRPVRAPVHAGESADKKGGR